MKRLITNLSRWAIFAARAMTGLAFLVIIGAVIVQLLGRSGIIASVIWTEELTRFALLWLTAFGAGLALRSGDLVNVDILSEALPGRFPWAFRLFGAVVTGGFALLLIGPAALFTKIGARQTAPALGLPMNWVHAATITTFVLLALFAALRILGMLAGTDMGRPDAPLEDK